MKHDTCTTDEAMERFADAAHRTETDILKMFDAKGFAAQLSEQESVQDMALGAFGLAQKMAYRAHRYGVLPGPLGTLMDAYWLMSGTVISDRLEDGTDKETRDRKAPDTTPGKELPPPTLHGEEIDLDADKLMFWFNAFIPGDAPFSSEVPDGPYKGKRMIPGPFSLSVWPFTMLPGSDCYLNDNRGFSNKRSASCRMHSLAVVDLASNPVKWDQHHRCDKSVEVDCEDGDEEEFGYADRSGMEFSDFSGTAKHFTVNLEGSAFDPVFNGINAWLVPNIDYEMQFIWIDVIRLLIAVGKVDEYPAFECYAQRGAGTPRTLFQLDTVAGRTPAFLYGGASVAVGGAAHL